MLDFGLLLIATNNYTEKKKKCQIRVQLLLMTLT